MPFVVTAPAFIVPEEVKTSGFLIQPTAIQQSASALQDVSRYLQTLPPDRIGLLAHYSFEDIARKVVGVGSVGTIALVLLLKSGDNDPLVLQIKQANASVLEPYAGASQFANHGERVVVGQRVLQTSGDPFLGWVASADDASTQAHDFYIRQLKDMKGSLEVEALAGQRLAEYGVVCAATLARHAAIVLLAVI